MALPAALVNLFPGAVQGIELRACTVGKVMDELDARWPGMRDRLYESTLGVRGPCEGVRRGERANLQTGLAPGSEVIVVTAISGGRLDSSSGPRRV